MCVHTKSASLWRFLAGVQILGRRGKRDEIDYKYDKDYFKHYYLTIAVYSQWGFYCDYDIIEECGVELPKCINSCIVYDVDDVINKDWKAFVEKCVVIKNRVSLNTMLEDNIADVLALYQDYEIGKDCYDDSSNEDEENSDISCA